MKAHAGPMAGPWLGIAGYSWTMTRPGWIWLFFLVLSGCSWSLMLVLDGYPRMFMYGPCKPASAGPWLAMAGPGLTWLALSGCCWPWPEWLDLTGQVWTNLALSGHGWTSLTMAEYVWTCLAGYGWSLLCLVGWTCLE